MDAFSGKKVPEKGLAKRVVLDLTAPFVGVNHVVYCDNFYSSGPLADALANDKIFITGTIKKNASGFPDSLKCRKPPQGGYVSFYGAIIIVKPTLYMRTTRVHINLRRHGRSIDSIISI